MQFFLGSWSPLLVPPKTLAARSNGKPPVAGAAGGPGASAPKPCLCEIRRLHSTGLPGTATCGNSRHFSLGDPPFDRSELNRSKHLSLPQEAPILWKGRIEASARFVEQGFRPPRCMGIPLVCRGVRARERARFRQAVHPLPLQFGSARRGHDRRGGNVVQGNSDEGSHSLCVIRVTLCVLRASRPVQDRPLSPRSGRCTPGPKRCRRTRRGSGARAGRPCFAS